MGKSNKYLIPLKTLSEGTHTYEYMLDDAFFAETDSPEISKGAVATLLTLRRTGNVFELHFTMKGHIGIPCDRCLEEMTLPVDTEETLYVKFGEEYSEEDDNLIVVPESEGSIDIAWNMFETIALTIPLKHTHADGECNPEMEAILKAHTLAGTESDENDDKDDDTDPRWNALKKLKENK